MAKAIAIVSGGMDSTVMAYSLHQQLEGDIMMVSFNYGQRHVKELDYARLTAEELGVHHAIVPMEFMSRLLHGSALTDDIDVPEGHYASDNMRVTVVPNRNSIMLNIATGIAVAEKAEVVATAVHAGDHAVYPDCRPEFIEATSRALKIANEGFISDEFQIYSPFVYIGKHDICRIGAELGVPFENTWSCYKGNDIHCGKCGTCVERKEAFAMADVVDPTEYEDEKFGVAAYRG